MQNPNIYSKRDIERIVDLKMKKALDFRIKNIEKTVDKLRLKLNDIEILLSKRYGK